VYTASYTGAVKLFKKCSLLTIATVFVLVTPSCIVLSAGGGGVGPSEDGSSFAGVPEPAERESARTTSLEVVTDPEGATLYLGYRRAGETPLTLDDMEPGRYRIRVEKSGYYAEERLISLERGEAVVLDIELERITGYLSVRANVSDLTIIADGTTYNEDFIELPIGAYRVHIRRFGYLDVVKEITIEPEQETRLDVELRPAPFTMTNTRVSRSTFNPANPGLLGRTALTFEVSAPGMGVLRIIDELGRVVKEQEVGPFETWEQRVTWDGSDAGGQVLGEGTYRLELQARGTDGTRITNSSSVEIDPSLLVHYRSLWGGFSGLSFAPTAKALPPATFQISAQGAATLLGPNNAMPDRYPIRFGLRAGLGAGFELGAFGGLVPSEDPTETRWNVGGSLLFTRLLSRRDAALDLAVGGLISGVYQSPQAAGSFASADTYGSHAGFALATPVTVGVNGVTATIAPEYRLSPAPIAYAPQGVPENQWTHYGYLRGGVLYDVFDLTLGVSGVMRTRIDDPFEVVPFQAGFDASYVIPSSPVAVSFQVVAEWDGAERIYLLCGVGFGLLF